MPERVDAEVHPAGSYLAHIVLVLAMHPYPKTQIETQSLPIPLAEGSGVALARIVWPTTSTLALNLMSEAKALAA